MTGTPDDEGEAPKITAIYNIISRIGRDVIIVILGFLLVFEPNRLAILQRFIVKTAHFTILGQDFDVIDAQTFPAGVEVKDGKLLVSGVYVDQISDTLAQKDQKIQDLTKTVGQIGETAASIKTALAEAIRQRDEAKGELATLVGSAASGAKPIVGSSPTDSAAPSPTHSPVSGNGLINSVDALVVSLDRQVAVASKQTQSYAQSVQTTNALPGTGYGVVISGDVDASQAEFEAGKARKLSGDRPILIYHRVGSWRTVAYYGTQSAAQNDLALYKGQWPTAYVVSIANWCPNPRLIAAATPTSSEQKDCGF
jgi:hypothetical protein